MRNVLLMTRRFLATLLMTASAFTAANTDEQAVVENYANIAHAVFTDSLTTAQQLQQTISGFLANPSPALLEASKAAWKQARVPYQQSEVFRFGNSNVDDWEGQLNAWPLDEGLIDYVHSSYEYEMGNVGGTANIIANTQLVFDGETIDTSTITPELLASLNELGGSEANVATGYHAIEFLLWGQDLNGTKAGAGNRPYTDFVKGKACTHGHCQRRAQYLAAATALLVSDLEDMVRQWAPGKKGNYRAQLLAQGSKQGLTKMLYGMGSLALGELAGERIKVALEANSPEDEHDCFSDNTHFSHFYNAKAIQNIYLGRYQRTDGSVVTGPSLADLVKASNADLAKDTEAALAKTQSMLQVMVDAAEDTTQPMKFDQMIAEGNQKGKRIAVNAINALVAETVLIEKAAAAIGITNLNPDTADHSF